MPVVESPSSAAVVAAIEAVPSGAMIATDADGTLWSADVGDDLVRCGATSDAWPDLDLDAYLQLIEEDYAGGCLASAEYLRGRSIPDVQAAFRAWLDVGPRAWLIDALVAAERRRVEIVVVSASPRIGLEVALELVGVSWSMVAVELDVEPAPIAEGKVAAWRARDLPRPALALGDSRWDLPLLEFAELGFRLDPFHPTPERGPDAGRGH